MLRVDFFTKFFSRKWDDIQKFRTTEVIPHNVKDFQENEFSHPKEGLPFSIYYPNNETMRITQNLRKKTSRSKYVQTF